MSDPSSPIDMEARLAALRAKEEPPVSRWKRIDPANPPVHPVPNQSLRTKANCPWVAHEDRGGAYWWSTGQPDEIVRDWTFIHEPTGGFIPDKIPSNFA